MTFIKISDNFRQIANELGLGFGYAPFKENATPEQGGAPPVPYIAFNYPSRPDFAADNGPYIKISRIRILLVTKTKDIGLELAVQKRLEDLDIHYTSEYDYYSDEDVFVAIYETEEIIDADCNC